MRLNRRSVCGFTLIELIVVISVIGVLAGLLLPSLAKARQRARLAQCTSQLRQLGLAIAMYDQDHDVVLENCPDRLTHLYGLHYATDPRLFICPADYTKATKASNGREALKPGNPTDDKADWAERASHGVTVPGLPPEQNCSYLYEFSTRECVSWWDEFLVLWDDDIPSFFMGTEPDRDGDGIVTWQEAKYWQLNNSDVYSSGSSPPGMDGIPTIWSSDPWDTVDLTAEPMRNYPRTMLPIVRCFWHCTPAMVDIADNQNRGPEEVLNLAVDSNVFFSVPGWEQTAWKYGHSAAAP